MMPFLVFAAHHPSIVKTYKPRRVIIVIDAGHGGKDSGTIGAHDIKEKDVVLAIAKQLADLLNHDLGIRAKLTRKGDYFVTLRDRLKLARKSKADFFISIHADSYLDNHSSGVSVYALSQRGATSEAARWLANRENYSELGGINLGKLDQKNLQLRSLLIDLSQTAAINDSVKLGDILLNLLKKVTNLHYPRIEQAPFVVLKSPDIPSILIETGFISNADEALKLSDKAYQNQLATALHDGIHLYLKKFPLI